MVHQCRNVTQAVAKRRHHVGKDVQAVKQVRPERPLLDHLAEVPIGRHDDADIHPDRPVAADALEFLLLQHAQELYLDVERQLADLIEKERSSIGQLEAADPALNGPVGA